MPRGSDTFNQSSPKPTRRRLCTDVRSGGCGIDRGARWSDDTDLASQPYALTHTAVVDLGGPSILRAVELNRYVVGLRRAPPLSTAVPCRPPFHTSLTPAASPVTFRCARLSRRAPCLVSGYPATADPFASYGSCPPIQSPLKANAVPLLRLSSTGLYPAGRSRLGRG